MTADKAREQREKVLEFHDDLIMKTESLQPFALSLAYIYPAILRNSYIDIDKTLEKDMAFLHFLGDNFGPNHFIWKHIRVTA